jgi:dephospho-CoA kinase
MSRVGKVIGLVGLTGSGKSTSARIIISEYGFVPIKPGDHIRRELVDNGLLETPENERVIQVTLRERYGMDALIKLSMARINIELEKGNSVLLDSMCSYSEREYLRSALGDTPFFVIAVHAPYNDRQKRLAARPRRPLTADQMIDRDNLEVDRLEKAKLIVFADFHLINNAKQGTLEEYTRTQMRQIDGT